MMKANGLILLSNAAASIKSRDGSGMQLLPSENDTPNVARQAAVPSVATSTMTEQEKKEKERFLMYMRVLMK